ncbi:MAG: FAD-binding dehydrogenase, partial [Bacillaceae bacterium]|nr:FAD-binding dehydrogenase [Bacillaceae bacterium]
VREGIKAGFVDYRPRHRVDEIIMRNGAAAGVKGSVLEPDGRPRGEATSRTAIGEFEFFSDIVLLASGGIGGNFDLVRKNWPARLGNPPESFLSGVPKHVDGRMLSIAERAGARIVNKDRMWHYTEGIRNWNPVWPHHGIRILPGPSSLWLDAAGNRLPVPCLPGFDTLGTLKAILATGFDYSWFILTEKIIEKEFALSGSEQNPDLTEKSIRKALRRVLPGPTPPVKAFMEKGEDFIVADSLEKLVDGMNRLTGTGLLDYREIKRQILARDREMDNKFTKDLQIAALRNARHYMGDRLARVAKPHKILDPKNGPLIAVRLHILTRKTLGGLQTDLSGRVLGKDGRPVKGLYAAGEAAGFGGGGMHGYRSLEGTFLGGCLFTGRQAGRAIEQELRG